MPEPANPDSVSAKTSKAKRRFSVDALFTDTRPQATGVSDLTNAKEIELTRIVAEPDQPRRTFEEVRLEELTTSIQIEGILQPGFAQVERDFRPGQAFPVAHVHFP